MVNASRPASGSADPTVRTSAVEVIEQTLESSVPVTTFLGAAAERLGPKDRGLLNHLVLGVLRWKRRLDHVLQTASNRPLDKVDPALRVPLRLGAYQILYLDRIPPHAAVSTTVDLVRARSERASGFANAVMRRVAERPTLEEWPVQSGDPIARLGIETSHPDFLVYRWLVRLGRERTEALLAANNLEKPMQLLAFNDKGGREALAEDLAAEDVVVEKSQLSPVGLVVRSGTPIGTSAFQEGRFYIQDEASQVAALIPPPRAGERVLDVAASPGGKSFAQVAFEPGVRPVLADRSVRRVGVMAENVARLGRHLPLVAADGMAPPITSAFDRVLLDLPCSGTGTFRKNPELKWRVTEAEINRLSSLGRRLLSAVSPLVRSGGRLTVITCSLEPEENEDIVERFLSRHRDFELESFATTMDPWIQAGLENATRWRLTTGGDHDGFTVHSLLRS